jgi:YihY family inner membrane protein
MAEGTQRSTGAAGAPPAAAGGQREPAPDFAPAAAGGQREPAPDFAPAAAAHAMELTAPAAAPVAELAEVPPPPSAPALFRWADAIQRRQPVLAFPIAVIKKFGDDHAGQLATLCAYYAIFAIFPLLLILVTVLGIVLQSNRTLQTQILDSAFAQFPIIGDQLQGNVHSLNKTGLGLAVGLLGTLFGARGIGSAMQHAAYTIWGIPYRRRRGFPWNILRSLVLIIVVGTGLLGSTVITGFAISEINFGPWTRLVGIALAMLLNTGVFTLAFRLAVRDVPIRSLLPGACLAAVGWQVLQLLGGLIVTRTIARASPVYGFFTLVIVLLTWLGLSAQIVLLAMEIDAVRVNRLWPRALVQQDPTRADLRAFRHQAQSQLRTDEQEITVRWAGAPPRRKRAPGTAAAGAAAAGAAAAGPATAAAAPAPATTAAAPAPATAGAAPAPAPAAAAPPAVTPDTTPAPRWAALLAGFAVGRLTRRRSLS